MKSSSSTMLAKTLLAWLQCMLSMFVERVILFFSPKNVAQGDRGHFAGHFLRIISFLLARGFVDFLFFHGPWENVCCTVSECATTFVCVRYFLTLLSQPMRSFDCARAGLW